MRTLVTHAVTISVGTLLLLAVPSTVEATYTSTISGTAATMTGDGAGDTLSISESGGLFRHNRFTAGDAGFNSDFDFNTSAVGDQTISSTTGAVNINAGLGNDTITIGNLIDLRGSIDGGGGTDTLDYSAYTSAVSANLGLGASGFSAVLHANQEAPPTTHAGSGTAAISNYNIFNGTFNIDVTVTDLSPGDVIGFHIHRALVGANGPIIVDFTSGPLVPSGTGFTFSATGVALPGGNEGAFISGATYLNIHTSAFPGGAIRGQLFSTGNVNHASGIGTATTSIIGIENLTGGTGADSLLGNSGINTIDGGGGGDWLAGGPGNDILNGGSGDDVLVWSNGDGTDVDEGGADVDTVQVNGSLTNVDGFTVSAGAGGRISFARTNIGPFTLDIGTVETLTVNGNGGNDTVTVNQLAGVAWLSNLNLNGFDGDDGFIYVPTSSGQFGFQAHGGSGTDTVQGPDGAVTWNVTASNLGSITGLVSAFRFMEALNGGSASDTFQVKAFATGTPTVSGGAGTDTLTYDAEGRTVSGDRTPPDGLIASPGVQSLSFMQFETVNVANEPGAFTDPVLTPGVTSIRGVHITELRTRVNAVRAARGLGAYAFSDPDISTGVTPVRAAHVLELRTALAEAYVAAGMTPPTYTAPVPATGVVVLATAISELRAAVVAIE